MAKVSGPILDRIDIHVDVPAVRYRDLAEDSDNLEDSATIRSRINLARPLVADGALLYFFFLIPAFHR